MTGIRVGRPRTTSTILTALFAAIAVLLAMAVWSAPSASAASTVYEAESAALSGGAVVGTEHTGYTGTGFVEGYTDATRARRTRRSRSVPRLPGPRR
jgi:ABC-type amino acid transport substrate-binding protein